MEVSCTRALSAMGYLSSGESPGEKLTRKPTVLMPKRRHRAERGDALGWKGAAGFQPPAQPWPRTSVVASL